MNTVLSRWASRAIKTGLAISVLAALVSAPGGVVMAAGGYVVNSTLDTHDANTSDTVCDDGAGNCTLRAALEQANGHAGADSISFKITSSAGPWTISPASAYPLIMGPVKIDALKGTGANCKTGVLMVTIDGNSTSGGSSGLYFYTGSSGSSVSGLVITGFPATGIIIDQASKIAITCNFLGIQRDGVTLDGNGQSGIHITGNGGEADEIVIGGASTTRNVISGNSYGIFIENIVDASPKGNKIQANFIGTDVTGKLAKGNNTGIWVQGATKTMIGGTTKQGNVISANTSYGVQLFTGADNTLVQGNMIGVDVTGQLPLGNGFYGLAANDASNLTIGGKAPSFTNVISGNYEGIYLAGASTGSNNVLVQGNMIGVNATGTTDIPNSHNGVYLSMSSNSTIGGTTTTLRNVISGNTQNGVYIVGPSSTGNVVAGNFIGTDKTGYYSIPNIQNGVYIYGANNNTVGGTVVGARNLISGNNDTGVKTDNNASNITISGNYIGVNIATTAALPNVSGVTLMGCANCLVGGLTNAAQRNVISGNGSGIGVVSGNNTQIFGNYIGLNSTGTAAIPNEGDGLYSSGSTNTQIGSDSTVLARNVIAGNLQTGISLSSDTGTSIKGNYIGVSANGTAAMGNTIYGIYAQGTANASIGGATALARNVIANSNFNAIYIYGVGSTGNVIQGNYIGTNAAGTVAMPNGTINGNNGSAVYLYQATGNTIGGANPGEGNVISGNSGSGIYLISAPNNAIKGNIIGLDPTGTLDLGNTGNGIYIYQTSGITIGGNTAGAGNVISGNGQNGIQFSNLSDNLVIKGNKVGTNSAGTAAVPNNQEGINGYGSANLTVGGPTAADGNLVSGNGANGVGVGSGMTGATLIQNNVIGTDITHSLMLGNTYAGINSSVASKIANNVIAFNGGGGINQYNVAFAGGSTNNCLFYNTYPIGLAYSPAVANSFINNWWGDAAGPVIGLTANPLKPARQNLYDSSAPYNWTTYSPFLTSAPSGCPSGIELLTTNPGMETDTTPADGIPDGWTGVGVTSASGEGRRTDYKNSGSYSMKMVGGGLTSLSQTVTAGGSNAGHSIILSYYTRGTGVSGTGIYQVSVKIGTQVFTKDIVVNSSGSTGGWVHKTLNFKAPANFTSAIVTLTFSRQYGSIWWDDLSLLDVTVTP